MQAKEVDLHLIATAHLAAGREALRLLGLSWIHTTDQEIQRRVFASVIDTAVPFAGHCRRLIELANTKLGENERHSFRVDIEIDNAESRAQYPADLKTALDLILHSRTLKGVFARIREMEIDFTKNSIWADAAKSAVIHAGEDCLGVPGQNPWRYSPVIKVETDQRKKHSIPTIILATMYFDLVEPRTLNTFGGDLSRWNFFDVA